MWQGLVSSNGSNRQKRGRGRAMICHPATRIGGIRFLHSLLVDRRVVAAARTVFQQRFTGTTGETTVSCADRPKDRPIDGVDASAFMLGKSQTTGRDTYMFFDNDGELLCLA